MAEDQLITETKWEGKFSSKVKGATADQIWPFLEDFCSFHKWLPGIDTCYQVEGVYGQPGLIRYCDSITTTTTAGSGGEEGGGGRETLTTTKWAREKLVMIDPIQRCLSYEIVDSNMGFKSYVGTWKVIPMDDDEHDHGCLIEWSFIADPIEGMKSEDFSGYIEFSLRGMVERMENATSKYSSN